MSYSNNEIKAKIANLRAKIILANTVIEAKKNISNKQLKQRTINLTSPSSIGWNITPNSVIKQYSTIGKNGTFVTDENPFERVLGIGRKGDRNTSFIKVVVRKVPRLSKFVSNRTLKRRLRDISFYSGTMTISERKARKLERTLGLNRPSRFLGLGKPTLESSNAVSLVSRIDQRSPRIPKEGNKYFRLYKGLPKKDPELTIKSIPSDAKKAGDKGIRQIQLSVRPDRLDRIIKKIQSGLRKMPVLSRIARQNAIKIGNSSPLSRFGEFRPPKKQGTKEKIASLRNRSRDRHQNRDKALKRSGDQKLNRLSNSKERLKSRYGKPRDTQRGNVQALKDRSKIGSNSSERTSAKKPSSRPGESRPSKKQGTKEKMASLRNRSRDRHQNRDKALKKSGDQKQTRPNNSREHLKSRYGKPTEGQRGNIKPLKDRAKISSNQSDRASAKNKPSNPSAESRPSKKQGTGEKMSVKRSQSRAKYQERNQSLKKSRDQKAKPPTATRDNTKARYGKSSEANRTKELSASNRELKKSGNSITSQQDSKSKPRGDSKPNRGGGGSRGKESRRR